MKGWIRSSHLLRNLLVFTGSFVVCTSGTTAEQIPMTPGNWEFFRDTSTVMTYKGVPALSLFNDAAWLKNTRFRNGTISFKVAFPKDRGFVGIRFRARDKDNYEHFYLRPHQSGKPDANQYTPVFHGNSGWQIYYGPRFSVPVPYRYGTWIDVRLVISGDKADVYIDSDEPILHIADLKRGESEGAIGFDSFLTHAFISELRITHEENPNVIGESAPLPELPEHRVKSWEVAGPLPPLAPDTEDIEAVMDSVNWQALTVESNGIANLGRIGPNSEERDTILARITIRADRAMTKRLHFGFSDKVTAFVNGRPVYQGDNTYRTRDYRYLGTVGRFNTLILPLSKGPNEIVFAVGEDFGGWALTAAFEDMNGIEIAPIR